MNERLINCIAYKFMNMKGTHEDLDDLKQEARIHVLTHPNKKLSTTIGYGLRKHSRRNRAKKRNDTIFTMEEYNDAVPLDTMDITEAYDAKIFYDKALSILNERDRYIVDSHCNNMTFDLIGTELGISKQRVLQLYDKSIERIRRALEGV
jgi:RNA polymerase sigma factor (sigma-70 family)